MNHLLRERRMAAARMDDRQAGKSVEAQKG
jgi:hypothetical protein